MAGIDKIYCYSKKDFNEFYAWCKKMDPLCIKETQMSLLDNFYTTPELFDSTYDRYSSGVPITNFRYGQDMWLLYHCPIKWVRNYMLRIQYPSVKLKKKKIKLYIDYQKIND